MSQKEVTAQMLADPRHFLSLGFGSGLSPFAPGTAGTLAAIPVYLLMTGLDLWSYVVVTVLFFMLGVHLCSYTSRYLGVHDHGAIVWDEVVGYLLTMLLVPVTVFSVILGFIAFRLFDIWKPWPVKILDARMKGGFGIMIDDVGAAIYAGLTTHAILYFIDFEMVLFGVQIH